MAIHKTDNFIALQVKGIFKQKFRRIFVLIIVIVCTGLYNISSKRVQLWIPFRIILLKFCSIILCSVRHSIRGSMKNRAYILIKETTVKINWRQFYLNLRKYIKNLMSTVSLLLDITTSIIMYSMFLIIISNLIFTNPSIKEYTQIVSYRIIVRK